MSQTGSSDSNCLFPVKTTSKFPYFTTILFVFERASRIIVERKWRKHDFWRNKWRIILQKTQFLEKSEKKKRMAWRESGRQVGMRRWKARLLWRESGEKRRRKGWCGEKVEKSEKKKMMVWRESRRKRILSGGGEKSSCTLQKKRRRREEGEDD